MSFDQEDKLAENVGSTTEKPLEGNTAMSGAVGPAQETLAATLWSERRRIFIGTAAAILIFSVYALLGPRQWEAGATLMPPDQSSSSGGALQGLIAARAGQDLGGAGLRRSWCPQSVTDPGWNSAE